MSWVRIPLVTPKSRFLVRSRDFFVFTHFVTTPRRVFKALTRQSSDLCFNPNRSLELNSRLFWAKNKLQMPYKKKATRSNKKIYLRPNGRIEVNLSAYPKDCNIHIALTTILQTRNRICNTYRIERIHFLRYSSIGGDVLLLFLLQKSHVSLPHMIFGGLALQTCWPSRERT